MTTKPPLTAAVLTALLLVTTARPALADEAGQAVMQKCFEAHGGLEHWQDMGTFAYTMTGFPLSEPTKGTTQTTVDLQRRAVRIDGSSFIVAFDGNEAWALPHEEAAGLPPRFITTGSSYFIMMPFVFGDPGTNYHFKGTRQWQGQDFVAVGVTYDDGVGYSDDDDYVLYLDPDTYVLRLIHHTATEAYDPSHRVTWGFESWQEIDGLFVPEEMTFYKAWDPDNPPTEGVSFTIDNVELHRDQPEPAMFEKP